MNEIIEFNFVNLTNLKVLILNANSTLNLIELDGLVSLERFECLSCGNVTSLDFSSCISLNGIATSSSMIQYINLKNGKIEDTILLNNTLSYLCVDQDQVDIINNDLPHFGLENCNVNS